MHGADAAARRPLAYGAAIAAGGIVALVIAIQLVVAGGLTPQTPTVNTRLGLPQNRAEQLIWGMDGKAFFQLAVDPTLAHQADAYGGSASHGAYRSTRPVLGWGAWALSAGGQRPILGWVLLGLSIAAISTLVLALDAVARALGRKPPYLAAVVATPGVLAAVVYPGLSEPLALTLAFAGLAAWLDARSRVAVALFCCAALTRESTLLIPAGLALAELLDRRGVRRVAALAVPFAVYGAWFVAVRARVGAWPSGDSQLAAPFVGLVGSVRGWGPMEWATLAITVVGGVWAWRAGPRCIRAIVSVHAALLACMSSLVWADWWAFGRIALPLALLGLISVEAVPVPRPSGERPRGVARLAPSDGGW